MKTNPDSRWRKAILILSFAVALTLPTRARTEEKIPLNILAGIVPYSMVPASYQSGFGGLAIGLEVSISPFSDWSNSVTAGYFSPSLDSILYLDYRKYFSGVAQYDQESFSETSKIRHFGSFIQVGPSLYSLTKTDPVASTQTIITGYGVHALVGQDYPVYNQIYVSPRVGYINSITGSASFSGLYLQLMVGIPFGI